MCKWPGFYWWRRGATAWEAQAGYIVFQYVHLRGGNWDGYPIWCFLGRFSIKWMPDGEEG